MTKETEIFDTVLPGRTGSCSNLEWRLCCAVAMRCALTLMVAASLARPAEAASISAEESARLLAQVEPRFKAIYERDEFTVRSFTATWLPDGSGYLKLETPAGASAAVIAHYDSAGGKRTVVVPSEKLVVPGGSQPLMLRWFQRAPSGNRFLLHGDITEGKRRSGHWLYEPESGALRPLDDGPGLWFDANAFSPDGQRPLATQLAIHFSCIRPDRRIQTGGMASSAFGDERRPGFGSRGRKPLAAVTDASRAKGMAFLASTYDRNLFDNVRVGPLPAEGQALTHMTTAPSPR